jgi:hypothetical protein
LAEVVAADRGNSVVNKLVVISSSMRYRIIAAAVVFFICSPFCSTAQKNSKTEFSIIFNPTLAYRYSTAKGQARKYFNEFENVAIRYDAGLLVTAFKNQKLKLETGVVYSRKGYSYKELDIRDTNGTITKMTKIPNHINFLEVPIRAMINLSGKYKDFIVAGLLQDIFLNSKIKDFPSSLKDEFLGTIRPYNLGLQIGYGRQFFENDHLSFEIEPNIKSQLLRMNTANTQAKRYLFTIGVSARVRFGI